VERSESKGPEKYSERRLSAPAGSLEAERRKKSWNSGLKQNWNW